MARDQESFYDLRVMQTGLAGDIQWALAKSQKTQTDLAFLKDYPGVAMRRLTYVNHLVNGETIDRSPGMRRELRVQYLSQ